MKRIMLGLAICAVLMTSAGRGEGLFLESQFEVKATSDLVYGKGAVKAPAPGDKDLVLDVYEPQGSAVPKSLPAIVLIHGGGFRQGDKAQQNFAALSREMASRGYVSFSINYRMTPDDPPTPGDAPVQRAIVAAVEDAGKAMNWVNENAAKYHIDQKRIAIGGGSAGAITSLFYTYGQQRGSLRPRAVVDLWGGLYEQANQIKAGDPPIIIIHGTNDQTVKFSMAEDIVKRAKEVGVACVFYPIAGTGHGVQLGRQVDGKTLYNRIADFLHEQMELGRMGGS